MSAPLLADPVVVRCARCRTVIRDERSRPGVPYRTVRGECAACRVYREAKPDIESAHVVDPAEPCEATSCCAAELRS